MASGRRTATAVLAAVVLTGGCSATSSPDAAPASTTSATRAPTSAPAPTTTPTSPTTTPTTSPTGPASPTPTPTTPPTTPTTAAPAGLLEDGDSGPRVRALQERLSTLGYWLGDPDGEFGLLTEQAVQALQKAAGLPRDGVVGPRTRAALDDGTRPRPRSGPGDGQVVEIDLDRQLLMLVEDGAVATVLSTSTGTFEPYTYGGQQYLADTPRGRWTIGWEVDGWRESNLGRLWRPKYFHPDGIAVHGYTSVPPYPASHGCARVTIAAMDWLWKTDRMPVGTAVHVY